MSPAPALAPEVRIDLWLWSLDGDAEETARARLLLTSAEAARADRFVHDSHRSHFINARAGMRRRLAKVTGLSPADLPLSQTARGKPFLAGGPAFNLSHAAGMAALVTCHEPGLMLGVDIEGARAVDPGLDALAFAPEERAALQALDPTLRETAFFLGWTRKEAVIKASGEGLFADLSGFAVSLAPGEPPRLLRYDGQTPDDWRLHDFTPRPGLAGAIACQTMGREIVVTRHP